MDSGERDPEKEGKGSERKRGCRGGKRRSKGAHLDEGAEAPVVPALVPGMTGVPVDIRLGELSLGHVAPVVEAGDAVPAVLEETRTHMDESMEESSMTEALRCCGPLDIRIRELSRCTPARVVRRTSPLGSSSPPELPVHEGAQLLGQRPEFAGTWSIRLPAGTTIGVKEKLECDCQPRDLTLLLSAPVVLAGRVVGEPCADEARASARPQAGASAPPPARATARAVARHSAPTLARAWLGLAREVMARGDHQQVAPHPAPVAWGEMRHVAVSMLEHIRGLTVQEVLVPVRPQEEQAAWAYCQALPAPTERLSRGSRSASQGRAGSSVAARPTETRRTVSEERRTTE